MDPSARSPKAAGFRNHAYPIRRSSVVKEPIAATLRLESGAKSVMFATGGDNRDRTGNLRLAKPALSQLSYIPKPILACRCRSVVGLGRVELPTSRLSGVRSNQLSYRPSRSRWKTAPWGPCFPIQQGQ